jgi:glycosyltransferase involved in cell wall biosynthesis
MEMNPPVLSILICGLAGRHESRHRLLSVLEPQAKGQPVEILLNIDSGQITIGEKRQRLLEAARGQYVCFVDDDDQVAKTYVSMILDALQRTPGATHCSLMGQLVHSGGQKKLFLHSTKYTRWEERNGMFVRPPNHLNAVLRELALMAGFPPKGFGEDYEFSERIRTLGVLTCEAYITPILYSYYPDAKHSPATI